MRVLRGAKVYEVPEEPRPPVCNLFIIPKSSKKISLILSYVKLISAGRHQPPLFSPILM